MIKKINWLIWLVLVMELWISTRFTFSRCKSCRIFVDFVYNYSIASIKILAKK